jgi:hypothetical protein
MANRYLSINSYHPNKIERQFQVLFWIGFLIYSIGYVISTTALYNVNILQGVQLLGLVILIPCVFSLVKFKIENKYLRFVLCLYFIWMFFIICRGFSMNYTFIKQMLFNAWYGIFLYFVPVVLLFPKSIFFYKRIFDVIIVFSLFCLLFYFFFHKYILVSDPRNVLAQSMTENISKTLGTASGFILLTYLYQPTKQKLIALATVLISLLIGLYRARRGLMFMMVCPLLFSYFIYTVLNRKQIVNIFISVLLLGGVVFYGIKVYNADKYSTFSHITNKMDKDTRIGVEIFFYQSMTLKDWIIGRGIDGKYYCPGFDVGSYSNYRTVIEADYLQIILKGGTVMLGLLMLMAIPAFFKGFFRSRNIFSKAAALWVLFWILDLYPSTVTTFTLNYILVWISVGICFSKEIRNLSDEQLIRYFKN